MENKDLVKDIIDVCNMLQIYCEGFDVSAKSTIISSKIKALFYISQAKSISPSLLIEKLGLAKSNIALLCKQLLQENLIEKTKDEFDNRTVLYSLTKEGNEYLNKQLEIMSFNFTRQLEYKNKFKEISELLSKLKEIIK